MNELDMRAGDALIVVDLQNDFCPGGALPIPEAEAILPRVNALIAAAQRVGAMIVASRDWHPADHMSFKTSGGPWPRHCVQDEPGAQFHPALRLPADVHLVTKGDRVDAEQYSAFDGAELADVLRRAGVRRVWVCGLALDVCVKATALDSFFAGFETILAASATAPVTPEGGAAALEDMKRAGVLLAA
jgi:nicotinamidase/pyrazinamidase